MHSSSWVPLFLLKYIYSYDIIITITILTIVVIVITIIRCHSGKEERKALQMRSGMSRAWTVDEWEKAQAWFQKNVQVPGKA